jgi:N-acetyl sugar amidotransferase
MEKSTPLFPHLQYCTRCCIPETQEGVRFDELGICSACQSSEQKMRINWIEREQQLSTILDNARKNAGNNYDCIIPISGGKDSTYQLHVLTKVYGMKPLAVTFSHNWWTETGWYNLQNALETFNVDHMIFTPNRRLINVIARRSIERIGDVSWHDHAGVGSYPLQIAVKYNIPLLMWGESIAESSGRATHEVPMQVFDRDYFIKVSAKLSADQMVDGELTERDLYPFTVPSEEEIQKVGVRGIHLGDYIFWDEERQTEFVRDTYGWQEHDVENAMKRYKSVEDIMSGMHDFSCYLKRGYGRVTYQASMDVRNGLLSRDEAFALVRERESMRPDALDYYLAITEQSEAAFYMAMKKLRVPAMQSVDIPITPKPHTSPTFTVPFPEQLIARHNKTPSKRSYLDSLM